MENTEIKEVYVDGVLMHTSEITFTNEELVELETNRYINRKNDGEKAFLSFAADLRLKKLLGEIDEVTFNSIEELLLPVRAEIVLGQWKTGLKKLEEINPTSIGVDLYAKINMVITSYITNNY